MHKKPYCGPGLQPCTHERTDCSRRTETGLCILLYDTNFPGKLCPFYGTDENNAKYMGVDEYLELYKSKHTNKEETPNA